MSATPGGFLIVLSDVNAEHDRDYLSWLTTEHVQERLGIPGFYAVRIFRKAIALGHRYFIWYKLANSNVVDSEPYLARLNDPTPWSQRIMPILGNFGRGGGTLTASAGNGVGEMIHAVSVGNASSKPDEMVSMLASRAEISAAHFLSTDEKKSQIRTNERELRTNDRSFAGLLLMESNSAAALKAAASLVAPGVVGADDWPDGIYREVFALSN